MKVAMRIMQRLGEHETSGGQLLVGNGITCWCGWYRSKVYSMTIKEKE